MKKLRLLLRKKAAEELKKEQERKAAERRRIIEERCGQAKNLDDASEAELQTVCREFHKRLAGLESEKYDLEWKNEKLGDQRTQHPRQRPPRKIHQTHSSQSLQI